MKFRDKKVLVVGAGISGVGAAALLLYHNAHVTLYDGNISLQEEILREKFENSEKITIHIGELKKEEVQDFECVVVSPGVPLDLPVINMIKEMEIQIIGEVELAFLLGRGEVLAITGTNGKTTTTALLGEIIQRYKKNVFVVGNIGTAYTTVANNTDEESTIVAEVSSFQLESISTFRPKVAAVLNVTPDHLDRHHTLEAYIEAKYRILENQTPEDVCVLNYEDEVLQMFAKRAKARVMYFSSKRKPEYGFYLKENQIVYVNEKEESVLCSTEELKILGVHNYENVMAASAMAVAYKIPFSIIREAVLAFKGVPHRIEFVCEKEGVAYYNDSKGTNPDAAIKAVQAMNRPTILIGGGYDKDSQYDEWIESFEDKIKCLVLLGATKDKIAQTAQVHGFENIVKVDTFEEAVSASRKYAEAGDAVLLSPACASWGMFKNYEERGDLFKKLVNQ